MAKGDTYDVIAILKELYGGYSQADIDAMTEVERLVLEPEVGWYRIAQLVHDENPLMRLIQKEHPNG